jgi:VanZ family protein
MNKKTQERILRWFPVAAWFAFISFLSSIPGGTISAIPSMFLNFINFPGNPFSKIPLDFYLFWGHRIAHFVEYSVLGGLVFRAYSKERTRVTVMTMVLLSGFIFLSGALDEWHQSFTPGRTPALIDAIFDTICGTFGMLVYKMLVFNKRCR